MIYGKKYKIDDTQTVTYLGEVNGKGIFLRNAVYLPYATWYYTLIDTDRIDARIGVYYKSLNDIFR